MPVQTGRLTRFPPKVPSSPDYIGTEDSFVGSGVAPLLGLFKIRKVSQSSNCGSPRLRDRRNGART